MKKLNNYFSKAFAIIAFAILSIGFSSCLNNDVDSDKIFSDFVSVVQTTGGGCYFVGPNNEIYTPTIAYTNNKNIKTALIVFAIKQDLSTTTQVKYTIILQKDPISLDQATNTAATTAKLDSVVNDSIVDFKAWFTVNGSLLTTVNYYMSGKKLHYITLCHTTDNGFVQSGKSTIPDTLKFVLHHNAKKDAPSVYSSNYLYGNNPGLLYMAYDIKNLITQAQTINGGKSLYIDVAAKTATAGDMKCVIKHSGFTYPATTSSK